MRNLSTRSRPRAASIVALFVAFLFAGCSVTPLPIPGASDAGVVQPPAVDSALRVGDYGVPTKVQDGGPNGFDALTPGVLDARFAGDATGDATTGDATTAGDATASDATNDARSNDATTGGDASAGDAQNADGLTDALAPVGG